MSNINYLISFYILIMFKINYNSNLRQTKKVNKNARDKL